MILLANNPFQYVSSSLVSHGQYPHTKCDLLSNFYSMAHEQQCMNGPASTNEHIGKYAYFHEKNILHIYFYFMKP